MNLLTRIFFLAALLASFAPTGVHARATTFKIATLAPEGSTWWKLFKDFARQVKDKTDGRVRVKIYAGGVAGDEPDVVRKLRVGQIHGAALTSVGLAELESALLVLQAPGLFSNWDELDKVRKKLQPKFDEMLDKKGYRVMYWGDVGFNRLFSNAPVKFPQDLARTKPWVWTQDGVYTAWYKEAGAKASPLGVPEVLPGLQTGLINAFSSPPLAALSLQWFTRVKYMLDLPINATIGGVIVSNKALKKLSDTDRKVIEDLADGLGVHGAEVVRADNQKAIEEIRKSGVKILTAGTKEQQAWLSLANKASERAAADGVFPKELLELVREELKRVRSGS